ncbi:sensor histidine kinase [Paenibacillus sp. CAU 1782]
MGSVLAILRRFVASTLLVSVCLLVFNFVLLGTLVFKEMNQSQSPEGVLKQVASGLGKSENGGYALENIAGELLRENEAWAMLLDGDGSVIWEFSLPGEIPRSYTLADIAKLSRYYLKDYPVYTWEKDAGLLVMGYPKWSYGKYQFQFLYDWGRSLPIRLTMLLLLNIAVALLISIVIGMRMMRGIRPLVEGVHQLARDEEVQLNAKGLFGDLAGSINSASSMLQSRTAALKARDEARSNWIAGISHDIRTPLSMVLGYSSDLEENKDLPEEQREQASIIRRQGEKLRSLVSDLNLVSMLEYEMQPLHLKPLRLAALSRQAAAELLNNRLDERYSLELNVEDEAVQISGDEKLLSRAMGNLLQNSVRHNPEGCSITVETFLSEDRTRYAIRVSDNGKGIPQEQLRDVIELPYSSKRKKPAPNGHGLGLPMVARIALAHRGQLQLKSDPDEGGMSATMSFPVIGQLRNADAELTRKTR